MDSEQTEMIRTASPQQIKTAMQDKLKVNSFHGQVKSLFASCLFLREQKDSFNRVFSPQTFCAIQRSHNTPGIVLGPETRSLSAVAQTLWLDEKSPYSKGK